MNNVSPTFEYCAITFLNNWVRRERRFYDGISGKNVDAESLQKALKYYSIQRGFPSLKENPSVAKIIGELIGAYSRRLSSDNVVVRVEGLAAEFKNHKRINSYNISAASKLLWLRSMSPVVIIDSQAKKALNLPNNVPYGDFYEAWQNDYLKNKPKIERASRKMEGVLEFSSTWMGGVDARSIVNEAWFHERVFDIYLWHIGDEKHD